MGFLLLIFIKIHDLSLISVEVDPTLPNEFCKCQGEENRMAIVNNLRVV